MSRPISESVSLLTETLGNCKTALTEKQVAEVDNIKISDVDEKIAEIQAGGNKFSIELRRYAGLFSDTFDNANCKLRSQDKSLNYEPTNIRQEREDAGDGDDFYCYSCYTFDIPKDDITKPTTLELYNADESDKVEFIAEIIDTGFWISYDPKFKLLKNDTNEHVGYLSEGSSVYGNKYKKLTGRTEEGIFEINLARNTITLVSNSDGFMMSSYNLDLITTTTPCLVYDGYEEKIISINLTEGAK